tara:strand:+ start:1605 stop:2087 length:483 start_codon:yes stop_codon:yes gene_type:complete
MRRLDNKLWTTGSGEKLRFNKVEAIVSSHHKKERKIFIGSDSFIKNKKICFVTAICLLKKGSNRYFYYRENVSLSQYRNLPTRITEEVRRSIEIAEHFVTNYKIPAETFELHLDVSPSAEKNETSRFSEMLKGYVQGYGLSCKLKPNAWASQSVADRHSK